MTGGLKKINRYLLASAGIIGIFAAAPEARAQSQQDLQQIQAQIQQMQEANRQMQETIKALQKQVQDAKAQAAQATATAASAGGGDLDMKVKWKGAPELSSVDGRFKMKVRGRLEVDYNNINQDTPITTFPDVSATELRRARIGVEGIAWYNLKYVLEVDFGAQATGSFVNNTGDINEFVSNDQISGVTVRDAYLQYQGFHMGEEPLLFRVGNFKTPNSFENLTSDRFVDTMERAAFINAWEIDRQIGFMTAYYADHWSLSAGIFGEAVNSAPLFPNNNNFFVGDESVTWAARGTWAPINREQNGVLQVLHLGASFRERDLGNDQQFFQYRAKGADFNLANFAVQTGRISEGDTFWGLEAAALWGPFSLQGEYGKLDAELPGGRFIRSNSQQGEPLAPNPFVGVPDPDYTGWYVEGSWFFGGHKTYDKEEARWGRPKVDNPMLWNEKSGWGALQLVGKYDVIDLSDTGNQVPNNQTGNPFPVGSSTPRFVGACASFQLFPGQNEVNPTNADTDNV